ncbi:UNVERIFIED_CONTAM: hypothetical protein Sradi_1619400 [Sesamum radiatum]|uniref:Retrotransposon gag domain-containing protein n=1 Tax=Sesamum radiatum TaxID=300843 RepID=A0AAW2UB29_SESRA
MGANRDDGIALPLKFALKGAKRKAQVAENDLLDDTMIHSSSVSLTAEIATVIGYLLRKSSLTAAVGNLLKHVQARDDQLNKLHNKFQRRQMNLKSKISNSIDSWDDLQNKFFSRFYSARRTVSMTELANQHQEKDEPVLDYINNWRNLSLSCKDALSEISAVELCIHGMHWELCYILQAIKPKTFGELATRAHGIEMSFNCKEDEYLDDASEDDGDDDDATP